MLQTTIEITASKISNLSESSEFLERINNIEASGECVISSILDLFDLLCTSDNSFVLLASECLISKHSQAWLIDDAALCSELAARLKKAEVLFQREMIYRALIGVLKRRPEISDETADKIACECSKDINREEDCDDPMPAHVQIPVISSGNQILKRLAGEALTGFRALG